MKKSNDSNLGTFWWKMRGHYFQKSKKKIKENSLSPVKITVDQILFESKERIHTGKCLQVRLFVWLKLQCKIPMSYLSIDRRVSSERGKEYIQSTKLISNISFYSLQEQPMEFSSGKYCLFIVVTTSLNE